uniref:Uncharacterized protein n=1 Tax=Anopheles melas TaxID=34690 RepID=A0A182TVQ8_9DIPT
MPTPPPLLLPVVADSGLEEAPPTTNDDPGVPGADEPADEDATDCMMVCRFEVGSRGSELVVPLVIVVFCKLRGSVDREAKTSLLLLLLPFMTPSSDIDFEEDELSSMDSFVRESPFASSADSKLPRQENRS